MTEFVTRLGSRKFLLAVSAFVGFLATREYDQAVIVVLGYLGVEGAADVAARRSTSA